MNNCVKKINKAIADEFGIPLTIKSGVATDVKIELTPDEFPVITVKYAILPKYLEEVDCGAS